MGLGVVSQQALSAQQPGLHAISLCPLVVRQVAAGNSAVAATSASPTIKDAMTLLSIALVFYHYQGSKSNRAGEAGRLTGACRVLISAGTS